MAASQYALKAVPIWAEQVPTELADIIEMAERWGVSVAIRPGQPVTLVLPASVGKSYATSGEWLMDKGNGDKGCCTNDEFVASFDPVAP